MTRIAARWRCPHLNFAVLALLLALLPPCTLAKEEVSAEGDTEDDAGDDRQCSGDNDGPGCDRETVSAGTSVTSQEDVNAVVSRVLEDKQAAAKMLRPMWQKLIEKKEEANLAAKSELGNEDELFEWLREARSLNRWMIGFQLNFTDRLQVVEQMAEVVLKHLTWTQFMGIAISDLVEYLEVAQSYIGQPPILEDCCEKMHCISMQIRLLIGLNYVGADEIADKHIDALRAALPSSGHCLGNTWKDKTRILVPQAVQDDKGNIVDISSMTRLLVHRGGSESFPSFFPSEQVPMAEFLEENAETILSELEPFVLGLKKKEKLDVFRQESLAITIAEHKKDWSSLNLYHTGHWHRENCDRYAPKTCALLEDRKELYGFLNPPKNPKQRMALTYIRLYRLRPGGHLFPHQGKPWVMNVHLGIHTPPGASIRVWNETETWERGKTLSFLDGAEHEVRNDGTEDRFVLSVIVWSPPIVKFRERSDSIRAMFVPS